MTKDVKTPEAIIASGQPEANESTSNFTANVNGEAVVVGQMPQAVGVATPKIFKGSLSGKTCPPKSKWECEIEDVVIASPFTCRSSHKTLTTKPVESVPDGMVKGQSISSKTIQSLFHELAETRELVKQNQLLPSWVSRKARYWMIRCDMALDAVASGNPVQPDPPQQKKTRTPGTRKPKKTGPVIGINPTGSPEVEQPVESTPVSESPVSPRPTRSKKAKDPIVPASPFIDEGGILKRLNIQKKALMTLKKHPIWPKEPSKVIDGEPYWTAEVLEPVFAMCEETA